MSVFIGSTTPTQRKCLSKEFHKLYAKKTFIPRKQKIAIALNTCGVGIKGVKEDKPKWHWVIGKYPNYRITTNRPRGKFVREPFESRLAAEKWIRLEFLLNA